MKNARGNYGQLLQNTIEPKTLKTCLNLFKDVCNSDKIDEHGNWEFGAEFDSKGRGYAINWDIYAIGKDTFSKKILMVIQIRKWEKRSRNGFASVKKSYFLLGRNEDNTAFAHPVEARVIHHAIKVDDDIIKAVQRWMFGISYEKIIRQGDLGLLPVSIKSNMQNASSTLSEVVLQESHHVYAEKIIESDNFIYALNPRMVHIPKTHPEISHKGWAKVITSRRGNFHSFAAPTID